MEFLEVIFMYSRHAVILILAVIGIEYLSGTVANIGKVGVAIGQLGDNLPPPKEIVALLLKYKIERVRIYDTNATLLSALAKSGIEVTVQVQNQDVEAVFDNRVMGYDEDGNKILFAEKWRLDNISPYVHNGTIIKEILVGNEWLGNPNKNYNASWLVPALYNIHAALQTADPEVCKLNITISTPHSFNILNQSFPPSKGTFDPMYHSVLRGVLEFLSKSQPQSTFQINIFPYFAYRNNPNVTLAFATFQSLVPIIDSNTNLSYFNIFDAQIDAVYFAINALLSNTTSLSQHLELTKVSSGKVHLDAANQKKPQDGGTKVAGTESGWPDQNLHGYHSARIPQTYAYSDHQTKQGHIDCKCGGGASIKNAQTYVQNSIIHVLKSTGTPAIPNRPLSMFIFALYDEDLKPGDVTERHYGIFYPNMTPAYPIDFNPPITPHIPLKHLPH